MTQLEQNSKSGFALRDFRYSDRRAAQLRSRAPRVGRGSYKVQPLPNTEPGLAGDTGASGDVGAVYGLDGLKVGA
jgi:hypothetical protein